MSKAYVFLADGFEDIEGLTVVDLLRRADIQVTTVSIKDEKAVTTSHGVSLLTDTVFSETDFEDADMLVLPGGKRGTENLRHDAALAELLRKHYAAGRWVAAICAAPTVLSGLGFLKGRKATSYPTVLSMLDCRETSEEPVVTDGNVITSRGMGTSTDFSLQIISVLVSPEKAREIADQVVYRHW